jgi:hypothetical protein
MPINLEQEKITIKDSKTTVISLIDTETLLSQFKLKSRNFKLDNIYQELVTFGNVQPSELMLRTLNLYRNMHQGQSYEDYDLCEMSGGTNALVLVPEISQPSEIFTDNNDDNNDIIHSYEDEFYGIFNHRMFDNDYCCICFIHEHDGIRDGYQFICQWDKKDARIPPAFIKAADLYCQLYDIKPIDHPFIFGAMMLSTAKYEDWYDTLVDNYFEDIVHWFLNGVINYLAKH